MYSKGLFIRNQKPRCRLLPLHHHHQNTPEPGSFPRSKQLQPALTHTKTRQEHGKTTLNSTEFLSSPWRGHSLRHCFQTSQENQLVLKEKPWLRRQEARGKEMLEDVLVIRAAPEFSLPNPAPGLTVLFAYNKHCPKLGVPGSQTELLHLKSGLSKHFGFQAQTVSAFYLQRNKHCISFPSQAFAGAHLCVSTQERATKEDSALRFPPYSWLKPQVRRSQ